MPNLFSNNNLVQFKTLDGFLSCFSVVGFLFRSRNQINHPFGLTLLHEHIYWTDWSTNSVYSAEINTGANITLLAAGLVKPMDIHAYSINPKQGESNLLTSYHGRTTLFT